MKQWLANNWELAALAVFVPGAVLLALLLAYGIQDSFFLPY